MKKKVKDIFSIINMLCSVKIQKCLVMLILVLIEKDLHVTKIILGIGKINSCHVGRMWSNSPMMFVFMELVALIAIKCPHDINHYTKIEFVGELIFEVV